MIDELYWRATGEERWRELDRVEGYALEVHEVKEVNFKTKETRWRGTSERGLRRERVRNLNAPIDFVWLEGW